MPKLMQHALRKTLDRKTLDSRAMSNCLFLRQKQFDASLMHKMISLPKVDLHRHLTGSITALTAVRLAAKYGVELPTYIAAELDRIYLVMIE